MVLRSRSRIVEDDCLQHSLISPTSDEHILPITQPVPFVIVAMDTSTPTSIITSSSKADYFNFMGLAIELRIMIYELIPSKRDPDWADSDLFHVNGYLIDEQLFDCNDHQDSIGKRRCYDLGQGKSSKLIALEVNSIWVFDSALLRTSSRIHDEALPMFYTAISAKDAVNFWARSIASASSSKGNVAGFVRSPFRHLQTIQLTFDTFTKAEFTSMIEMMEENMPQLSQRGQITFSWAYRSALDEAGLVKFEKVIQGLKGLPTNIPLVLSSTHWVTAEVVSRYAELTGQNVEDFRTKAFGRCKMFLGPKLIPIETSKNLH
jgi:hypothetical protein